ncbi:methyltransferase domain-containing protein [Mycetocola sp. 2940]|uniref:methyltransferase domain-containing protein n=1 Tax=Mycetocola sp. 2940 TaxID=3156452 RepID=UPI003390F924
MKRRDRGQIIFPDSTNYYATPELAAAYDEDSAGRRDLSFYVGLARELGASRVADIGAGTGLLCSLLAGEGYDVFGVEPEPTMLSLAASQKNAASVSWLHGTAEKLPTHCADLVLMTGHVAQYFLDDVSWAEVVAHAQRALTPGGRVAFEIRNPAVEAWREWETGASRVTSRGHVRTEATREGDLVTHIDHWTQGSREWTTTETLRFPSWRDVMRGLEAAGLSLERTWGDWDRSPVNDTSPEWIFLARSRDIDRARSTTRESVKIEPKTSTALHQAVSHALHRDVTALSDVRREPLEYDAFLAHRAVSRLRGLATVDGEHIPWSLIEKRTEGPALASPYLRGNGEREYDAYVSGMLDDIAPRLRAPHAHGTLVEPDGGITLWLEEIHHQGQRPLDARSIVAAAHDVGGLGGRWAGRERGEPWFFTEWIDRHGQPEAVEQGLATVRRAHPHALARLGDRLPRIEQLILAQPRVRDVLESLPHTLCHHDAVGANVFSTATGTVLVDWESIGPGPVGADLASLLFSSVRRGDASANVVVPLVDEALHGYIQGLRAEGARIEPADVRRGFDAAVALRWKLAVDVVTGLESGEAPRRGSQPNEPASEAERELIQLIDLLLASAGRVLD